LILDEWDFKGIFMEKSEELDDPQVGDVVKKLEK
jgi:hypothetical protein